MRIFTVLLAGLVIIVGVRLVTTALHVVFSGKILVRQGIRSKWQTAPARNEAWKIAIRDGLMGILLIVLGVVLLT